MTKRAMGALEAAVMETVWASDDGLTPREVRERLDGDLGYTTVMTVLRRLWEKDRLTREPDGRSFRYRPVRTAAEHHADRMRFALSESRDRPSALASFVSTLAVGERELLAELLDEA